MKLHKSRQLVLPALFWALYSLLGNVPLIAQSSMARYTGDWIYHDGGFCSADTFQSDGTAYSRDGRNTTGRWSVENGTVVVSWSNGWVNRVAPSGRILSGSAIPPGGGSSRSITFTRDDGSCGGQPSTSPPSDGGGGDLSGDWIYHDGGFCSADTLRTDGVAYSRDGRNTTGRWSVQNGMLVISWSNGWTNRVSPTPQGLSGTATSPGGDSRPVTFTRDNGSCGGEPSTPPNSMPGTGTGSSGGGTGGGGICADPRTLQIMDEWLSRAIPPQPAGSNLRYEAWGRVVGRSPSSTVTVNGKPDTRLTRCEWLWQYSTQLSSTNGLGTLAEYVNSRLKK